MAGRKRETTLREHVTRIGSLGGKARAENLSADELSAIGIKGGLRGGKAAADAMTPEERSARARKAAAARWGKKRATAKKKAGK